MRALLDVNMLIALLDPFHIHADIAHEWFETNEKFGWASCPITQNGYVRIVSQAGYDPRLRVDEAAALLRDLIERPSHAFWPETISILDPEIFNLSRLGSGRHVTDTYLLGVAKANNARFVTLDTRLSAAGVIGSDGHLLRLQ